MSDFNKIMVAVAFSPYTKGVSHYAARLVTNLNADLLVVNIINKRDVNAIKRLVQQGYEEWTVISIPKERCWDQDQAISYFLIMHDSLLQKSSNYKIWYSKNFLFYSKI